MSAVRRSHPEAGFTLLEVLLATLLMLLTVLLIWPLTWLCCDANCWPSVLNTDTIELALPSRAWRLEATPGVLATVVKAP